MNPGLSHLHAICQALYLQAAPAAGSGAAAPVVETKSLVGYIAAGGVVALILLLLSGMALALVIASAVMIRRAALIKPGVATSLDTVLRERRVDQALQICRATENDCALTRIVAAGLAKARSGQFGALEAKPAMEEAGSREADKLDRLSYAIRIVADLAPMLGLLGTVIGIIKAFATIGVAEGASRSSQLSANMSEALVNTALGLAIAIPCLVAQAFFRRRAEGLMNEVGTVAEELLGSLSGSPGSGMGQSGAQFAGQPAAPRPVQAAANAAHQHQAQRGASPLGNIPGITGAPAGGQA